MKSAATFFVTVGKEREVLQDVMDRGGILPPELTAFFLGKRYNRVVRKEAGGMYLDLVMLLNFLVDFFLLIAVNRLSGYPPGYGRTALAAILGGVYAGVCLLPGLTFLAGVLWRLVFLVLMVWIAFGWQRSAIHRGVMFVLLSMALGGIAMGLHVGGSLSLVASAGGVGILAWLSFHSSCRGQQYLPVRLQHEGKCVRITALRDTGNGLRDPLTGQSVLVVGAQTAHALTGLTREQLRTPTQSITAVPGLRLIPFRSLGKADGMLLALRIRDVQIGRWKGSSLVAFAPDGLEEEEYQALTGGVA